MIEIASARLQTD